jgi:hypothetical protein
MFTVAQIDEHLIGMGHSGTLNKIRNKEAMYERAASIFTTRVKTLEMMRLAALSSVVHDDYYDYALPSDFGSLLDVTPQDDRQKWDALYRLPAGQFDLRKAIGDRTISIEGREGTKMARINWRSRKGKLLNAMDDYDGNGTWIAVGGTTGIETDTITKFTGAGSVRFDLAATGNGISNIGMDVVDMTDEDEVADIFVPLYIPTAAALAAITSVTAIWGNDITTAFWTSTAVTTQADGSALRVGWNILKFSWATATETGTVAPATIDSMKFTFVTTGAVANLRLDNIVFTIGRAFDIKYYTKFLFKNATTGAYQSKPTTGSTDDYVLVDNDTLPMFLFELLSVMAHQVEGSDSAFDMEYAAAQLKDLYPHYKGQFPNQAKKLIARTTHSASRNARKFGRY